MNEKKTLSFKKFMTTELITTGIINALFGAGFGWLAGKNSHAVPMQGVGGVVMDVLLTCFLIGLLLTLISTPIVRKRIVKGEVSNISESTLVFPMNLLPKKTFPRAIILAILATIIFAPIILGLLTGMGVTEISSPSFIWVKAAYGALIAVVVVPYALMPMMTEQVNSAR